jgi:hypothetical protein
MKLKTLPPLLLLATLLALPTYAETPNVSQAAPGNDYGIEPEKLYQGTLILDLLTAANEEIDAAVSEAYSEGYKAGLLEASPDAAYWKKISESLRAELNAEKKKTFRDRVLFGAGGFALGVLAMGIYNLAR